MRTGCRPMHATWCERSEGLIRRLADEGLIFQLADEVSGLIA